MGNGNNETYIYLITEWHKEKWRNDILDFREILRVLHFEQGMSYRDLAKYFKVSLSTIYMWCKREGIQDKDMKW